MDNNKKGEDNVVPYQLYNIKVVYMEIDWQHSGFMVSELWTTYNGVSLGKWTVVVDKSW